MDLGLGVLEERQQQRREKDGFEALKSPGMLKRERERSRESVRRVVGVMDKEEEEEGEDLLGRLMGRAAGGVGEAREAKRRRVVGIEVL